MSTSSTPPASAPSPPAPQKTADEARTLMRRALKASLGTLDAKNGHPYASLVIVATAPDAAPLLLVSTLALHTQNLLKDNRASILFDGTDGLGDPLQGGRVSVLGRATPTQSLKDRARFLARHPAAALYADFADFSFFRLQVEGAHFVGGFGRINDIPPASLLADLSGAKALIAAEADIVEHMNEDHSDAIALYAERLLASPKGAWRMTGLDPLGCDLVLGDKTARLDFPQRVENAKAARNQLVALAEAARKRARA